MRQQFRSQSRIYGSDKRHSTENIHYFKLHLVRYSRGFGQYLTILSDFPRFSSEIYKRSKKFMIWYFSYSFFKINVPIDVTLSAGCWAISIWFHFICVPVTIVCIGDGFDSEIQSFIARIKWSVFAIETNVDMNIEHTSSQFPWWYV